MIRLILTCLIAGCCLLPASAQITNEFLNGIWSFQNTSLATSDVGIPQGVPTIKDGVSVYYVKFKAEEEITLKDGFNATSNGGSSWFHAYLVPPLSYAEMKEVPDGSYCTTIENQVFFRYVEKYSGGTNALKYTIYNYQNKMVITGTMNKIKGSNFLKLDLGPYAAILPVTTEASQFYLLEILNEKNDRAVLRFKYQPIL